MTICLHCSIIYLYYNVLPIRVVCATTRCDGTYNYYCLFTILLLLLYIMTLYTAYSVPCCTLCAIMRNGLIYYYIILGLCSMLIYQYTVVVDG